MDNFQQFGIQKSSIFTQLSLGDEENISGGQNVVNGIVLNGDLLEVDGIINGFAAINGTVSESNRTVNAISAARANPKSGNKFNRIGFRRRNRK